MQDLPLGVFGRWARFVCSHPYAVLAVSLVVTLSLTAALPGLQLDTSSTGFLKADDPALAAHDEFRREFGRSTPTVVVAEGADVFTLEFLAKLRALHEEIVADVPLLDETTSLLSIRSVRGADGDLDVHSLGEDWPTESGGLARFRDRVLAHPLYRNYVVSEDGRTAAILLRTEAYVGDRWIGPKEEHAIHQALARVVQRHDTSSFRVRFAGASIIAAEVQSIVKRDIRRFVTASIMVIAVLLGAMFRRVSAVLLPLGVVSASVLSCVGAMAATGVPLRTPTQILPSFLLAVGVCDSVHVLALFYAALDRGAVRRDAVVAAFDQCGRAITLTSLTTATGIVAFAVAELVPLAEFGVYGALGVVLAYLYTVSALAALLMVLPLQPSKARKPQAFWARFVRWCCRLGTRYPRSVIAVSSALAVVAAVGAFGVRISHDPLQWLPRGHELRVAVERIDRSFSAIMSAEVLVKTGVADGIHEPDVLSRIDALSTRAGLLDGGLRVGNTLAVTDIVKEIHQALHDGDPRRYQLPTTRREIAQELLLFEAGGSADLERVAGNDLSSARISVRIPWVDAIYYPAFLASLGDAVDGVFGDAYETVITGATVVMSRTVDHLLASLVRSYALCFVLITPLMALCLGSRRSSLVSAAPNILPIVLTLGLMGWAGMGLDATTLLVACIAVGLAVDDTIHFLSGYERLRARGLTVAQAIDGVAATTGPALLVTTTALAAGFSVFTVASMQNMKQFGALLAFAIVTAFFADVILAPALLTIVDRDDR